VPHGEQDTDATLADVACCWLAHLDESATPGAEPETLTDRLSMDVR
jgi:hypothetical protein